MTVPDLSIEIGRLIDRAFGYKKIHQRIIQGAFVNAIAQLNIRWRCC